MDPADTFPRQHARTRRFSLGAPRTFLSSPDGSSVLFLRSGSGDDPLNRLWSLDLATGHERVVADPAELGQRSDRELPEAERRRRERLREVGGGIVAYSADAAVSRVTFSLDGQLFLTDLAAGETTALAAADDVFDPRLDPTGRRIAYVASGSLRLVSLDEADRSLVRNADPDISWGVAEFIAAEEMGRTRGFWWSPAGDRLAVARVDNRPVPIWHIADPANPGVEPAAIRYPAAGADNAEVTLHLVGLDGAAIEVEWDRAALPYLADVHWGDGEPLTITVQSRDQRRVEILRADPATGATSPLRSITDDVWVELVPGSPTWLNGRLVTVEDVDQTRRVLIDGQPVTPPSLQVRSVVGVLDGELVVAASPEPTETHLFAIGTDGRTRPLTDEAGVHAGSGSGSVMVINCAGMAGEANRTEVRRQGEAVAQIRSHAEEPLVDPVVRFEALGERGLRAGLLMPTDHRPGERIPVLLDPYGGPHAQRVVRARNAFLSSQWFADQGFAVLVIDGRGTPARGPEWERSVRGDLAAPVLEDQVDGLLAMAELEPDLDLSRVGIRGWSFGGYLAALAVLRRPDIFHAAVAGAPVTDWRLYDTHYTERYLGHPDAEPDNYTRTDLCVDAADLTRPLMLVHGLADDNVVVAHTLALSGALVAAGRPHTVLPLSGVTHMTPQEVVAENLLLLQVSFLREALTGSDPATV